MNTRSILHPKFIPLKPPTRPGCLLSFDFDSTLHHPAGDPPVPAECFHRIRQLRERHGALWCINTGRSLEHLIEGMIESRFPFLPDWIVAREREIHHADASGRLLPHSEWNDRCESDLRLLFDRASGFLELVRREVLEHTGAEWISMTGEPAGVISRTNEEMDWICGHILALDPPSDLGWQRNTIYLRFGHKCYHKGSALAEISARSGLAPAACFAIGDGHNDLEMLDSAFATFIACPANAVPEVREKVRNQQGFIASSPHGAGVVEALDAFISRLEC